MAAAPNTAVETVEMVMTAIERAVRGVNRLTKIFKATLKTPMRLDPKHGLMGVVSNHSQYQGLRRKVLIFLRQTLGWDNFAYMKIKSTK